MRKATLYASYDADKDILNYTVKNVSTDAVLGYSIMYKLYKLEDGSETKISSYISPYASEALLSPEMYEIDNGANSAHSEYCHTIDDLELESGDYKLCTDVTVYDGDCMKEVTVEGKTFALPLREKVFEDEVTIESFFTVD